jgi:ferric-dicitrate binding protein FerR (iron transport regulator)
MFLLFIYQGYKTQLDDISTGSLAATEMTLPAGSVITDIDGTVDFDKTDWGSERHVQLSGTATFEVTKGVPFIVETDNGQVRVLGTKFTVTSEGDQFSVDVDHGKVRVTSGSRTQILTDQMSYHKNMEPGSTLSDNSIAYFQYDEAPLEEIITTLESVYHIEIAVDADITTRQQYTGFFDSSDLKTSLQSVFWPLGLTYQIEGNQVSISKE